MLVLLAVACASDAEDPVSSPTPPASVTEADPQPDPTASPETIVTSASPAEPGATAAASASSAADAPPQTTYSPTPTSTTTPSTTTAGPPPTDAPTTSTTSTTTTTLPDDVTVVEVVVREGRVVTENRIDVPLGNRISMRFDSDTRLLVHVHGFDEEVSVEAGVLTVFEFDGNIPGIFEVEDHISHRLLVELQVSS